MTLCRLGIHAVAFMTVAVWSFSNPSFADRGGNKGGSDGGHSGNNPSGTASGRGASGGGAKKQASGSQSFSKGKSSSSDRGSRGQVNRGEFYRTESDRGERHESFFRGPSDRFEENRGNRDRDFDRDGGDRELNRRDFNENNDNWRGGIFNDRFEGNRRFRSNNDWSGVRSDWFGRDRDHLPFRYGWWNNYARNGWPVFGPWGYSTWRNHPYYWWGYTPVGRLSNWLVFGWNRPRYWAYGPGANIYYQDDYVYYDGDRYLPVDDYYQQIYDLAHSVPSISEQQAKQMDLVPLGVFAVVRGNQQANSLNDEQHRTLQLAVSKDGVISGTYYNPQKGHVHPVTGMVDDHTQRAAWAFADRDHPKLVFETSVFNLSKDDSTMMVHFGPRTDQTEVWHLVRLEQPEGSQQPSAGVRQQYQQNQSSNQLP